MSRLDHLRRLLASFAPFDEAEAAHRSRMVELAQATGDPFSRRHFAPGHFTASAFVVDDAGGSLLLVLHGKLHRWLQPGGHVDAGDADILAAARREVAEEVGLTDLEVLDPSPFDLDIHPIPALGGDPPHEHFDVRFLMRAASNADFAAGSDAKAARWTPLEAIDVATSDASVMRAVHKLRARGEA